MPYVEPNNHVNDDVTTSASRDRHVTPKGQTRDPKTLKAQYPENSNRCYLATITNY